MKKCTEVMLTAFAAAMLVLTGCEETLPKTDYSLAGSVVFLHPYGILEAECRIGDTDLGILNTDRSWMEVDKVSDNSVRMSFVTEWEDAELHIDIPEVMIHGSRHDVYFDCEADGCTYRLDGEALPSGTARISGYIRLPEGTKSGDGPVESGLLELAEHQYDVDITVRADDLSGHGRLEFSVQSVTRDYTFM